MRRDTRAAYRARAAATERMVDEATAAVRAEALERFRAAKEAAREREATRIRYTAADLKDAVLVRTDIGWWRVIRVNGKSVTVETPYSWTERIPVDRVLEYREAK